MDSRTLVKKTLEFDRPPRVPRHLWLLPWATSRYGPEIEQLQHDFPDDIVAPPVCYTQPLQVTGDPYAAGTYVDDWGCTFENLQAGVIGEVKNPLVKTWADLDQVRIPEERLTVDPEAVNQFCRQTDRYVLMGLCARPFEQLQFLRGTENVFMDLVEQPPELFTLLDRMHQFYLKEMQVWVQTDIDALNFMDDWGTQHSLLISPATWRQIFKPMYQDYIDIAHAHGKAVFMHSDGHTHAIIPDLIELGLDAINTQIFCMDIEQLGRQFAGQITFWGEMDRQHLLVTATPAEVVAAVQRVERNLNRNGGVIAQCEFGAGGKLANVRALFETWNRF